MNTETGVASYTTPPSKPQGAPDDYINTGDLMKRFEPDTYAKMQEAIVNGGDWGEIFTNFVKKSQSIRIGWRPTIRKRSN